MDNMLLTLLLALFMIPRISSAQEATPSGDTISVKEAISMLSAVQPRVNVVKWHVESREYKLSDRTDPDSKIEELPQYYSGNVIYDNESGRYLAECETVSRWVQGEADFVAVREGISFDGNVFRSWEIENPGDKLPELDDSGGTARILPAGTERTGTSEFTSLYAWNLGIGFMSPNWWDFTLSPQPIAQLLATRDSAGVPITVTKLEEDRLQIVLHKPDEYRDKLTAVFDLASGGVCLEAIWSGERRPWRRLTIEHQEVDGFIVPRRVTLVALLEKVPSSMEIVFSDVKINPSVKAEDFRVQIPHGFLVDDVVKGQSYIASAEPIDEQAAVRRFRQAHNIPAVTSKLDKAPAEHSWIQWLILANVGIVLVIIAILIFRRLKRGGIGGILLMTFYILSGSSVANAQMHSQQRETELNPSPFAVREPTQCGHRVAIFALEHFGRKYSLEDVYKVLGTDDNNDHNISCLSLSQLLTCYGLKVQSRMNVRPQDISSGLDRDTIAIFPIHMGAELNHYVVALLDKSGDSLLVNVPFTVERLEDTIPHLDFTTTSGTVLYISLAEEAASAGNVSASPQTVRLGTFEVTNVDNAAMLIAQCRVENHSNSPVFVTSVSVSCGCTRPDWQGGLLLPGDSQNIAIEIRTQAWGIGRHTKKAVLNFADGSRLDIHIQGEGTTSSASKDLHVSRLHTSLVVPLTEPLDPISTSVKIKRLAAEIRDISLEASAPWLTSTFETVDEKSGVARLTVHPDKALLAKLSSHTDVVTSSVRLLEHGRPTGVTFDVSCVPKVRFDAVPSFVKLQGEGARADVGIVQRDSDIIQSVEVVSAPDEGIEYGISKDMTTITFRRVGDHPGLFTVKIAISTSSSLVPEMLNIVLSAPE